MVCHTDIILAPPSTSKLTTLGLSFLDYGYAYVTGLEIIRIQRHNRTYVPSKVLALNSYMTVPFPSSHFQSCNEGHVLIAPYAAETKVVESRLYVNLSLLCRR